MTTTLFTTPPTASAAALLPREYLTFRLGAEEYGIDILKVQEIRSYEAPTRLANAPAYIKGVVNLRGVIVPVVDLRQRFACANCDFNAFTVVIVLRLGHRTVGVIVDSVSDVLELAPTAIKPAPNVSCAVDPTYITGLGDVGDRTLILLDIHAMLMAPDMGLTEPSLAH
jgi:purine-binding chemotaxis protein CheW